MIDVMVSAADEMCQSATSPDVGTLPLSTVFWIAAIALALEAVIVFVGTPLVSSLATVLLIAPLAGVPIFASSAALFEVVSSRTRMLYVLGTAVGYFLLAALAGVLIPQVWVLTVNDAVFTVLLLTAFLGPQLGNRIGIGRRARSGVGAGALLAAVQLVMAVLYFLESGLTEGVVAKLVAILPAFLLTLGATMAFLRFVRPEKPASAGLT